MTNLFLELELYEICHESWVCNFLLFGRNKLGNIISAEGAKSYTEVTLEYFVTIDDLSMIESRQDNKTIFAALIP